MSSRSAESTGTRAHVVLGAGGVRTIAFVGVLRELVDAGVIVASVSACSAGSLFGALLAAGLGVGDIEQRLLGTDLRRLISRRRLPRGLGLLSLLRWPYARYDAESVVEVFRELIGGDPKFGDLTLPFATAGIDLLSNRFLVYGRDSHPDMRVSEAIRIAVSVPGLFPAHDHEGRIVVDAAVGTECPVWMAGRFDDDLPILALKTARGGESGRPSSLFKYVGSVLGAGVASRDQYLLEQIPRVRVVEIRLTDLEPDDFAGAEARKGYVLQAGRRAAQEALRRWGPGLGAELGADAPRRPPAAADTDGRAVAAGDAMFRGFHQRLSALTRSQVFISYSHADRYWLEELRKHLTPYVRYRGIEIWDDRRIQPGEQWREEIGRALEATKVAVLLVSPDFLSSNFIADQEIKYFLAKAQNRAVALTWIAVRPSVVDDTPLADFQALHDEGVALSGLQGQDLDRQLADIARRIAAAAG